MNISLAPVSLYNNINKSRSLTFKGYTDTSTVSDRGHNYDSFCIHETYFFRNIETMNFVSDFIKKNYPNGTNIAEFASSTGEEAYTLAMLLKDKNKDKKYKIFGYDISPKVVKNMDSHLYEITSNDMESFLVSDSRMKSPEEKSFRDIFHDSFEKIPKNWQLENASPAFVSKLLKKLSKTDSEDEQRAIKYHLSYLNVPPQYKWNDYYVPKKDEFKDVISFEEKDISDVGTSFHLPKNTNILFFKNAFYHLMKDYSGYDDLKDMSQVCNVCKNINKELPKGGLMVIGALQRDHRYNNQAPRFIIQEGKKIPVFDESNFHQTLKDNGFKPVFYEQIRDSMGNTIKNGVYLPSVWQKTDNIDYKKE
ncbi:MAG: hypothetical protein PHV37_00725 [Candidatus Gastranaerophilales bacterium]|nr:hypothetical protein [Candidatus Gastranaerophilales bacterium]